MIKYLFTIAIIVTTNILTSIVFYRTGVLNGREEGKHYKRLYELYKANYKTYRTQYLKECGDDKIEFPNT